MKNYYLAISGFFGASGVALGALGAHFLKAKMQLGIITADQLAGFDTAAKYQLFHAIVLIAIFFFNKDKNLKLFNLASVLFIVGILLFSGSIYLLSTRALTGLDSITVLGPITPIGGLAMIAGWMCIIIQSFKLNK